MGRTCFIFHKINGKTLNNRNIFILWKVGLKRIIVSYSNLLKDPMEYTKKIVDDLLSIGVKNITHPSEVDILKFVDSSLNRSKILDNNNLNITKFQEEIYSALEDCSILEWDNMKLSLSEMSKQILLESKL